MIWTKLNDPNTRPAHWTERIHDSEMAVFIYDAATRVARDADGHIFAESQDIAVAICKDLDEAVALAEKTVTAHPELCCEIYTHEGKQGDPVRTIYNPAVQGKYIGRPVARRQLMGGIAVLSLGLSLAITDYLHNFTWMWGYILGLKCLVTGGSLLARGIIGLHETKALHETKHSAG